VQKGDLVQVDFEGFCENQPIEDLSADTKGLGKRENFWVRADENAFLPEFAEGLLGGQTGEKRQVQVDFPDDFMAPELKGKQATYFVEIKGLREKKLPELDAAFFERLGMEDEAALRTRIREDMEKAAQDRETGRLRNAAIDLLLKDLEMDLPPTAVAFETQRIIENVVRDNTSRGVKESDLVEKKGEIMEMAQRNAESRVKVKFLLDRIADQEKIEVTARDVDEQIQRMAGGYGMSPAAFRTELKKRDALEAVEEDLRRSKTIDFIMEQAVIEQPEPTQEAK
jgi:trigger factor